MKTPCPALCLLTLLAAMTGCDVATTARPDDIAVAADPSTAPYCVLNAQTDAGTFHFEGTAWLLASVEGAGPIILDLTVNTYLIPVMSTSTTVTPPSSTISNAVGYSLTAECAVISFSRATVNQGYFQRVEAYPEFQRTVFEIRDASCGALLGTGASYKPIGVYFKVVDTVDIALPDVGVTFFPAAE